MKLFLLICFCCIFQQRVLSQSDVLVRSTTGISGSSETVVNRDKTYIIQQSIGQSSAIGTNNNSGYVLRQGFIQPNVLAKIIDKEIPIILKTIIYPNPFKDHMNVSFNEEMRSDIDVHVYDMLGQMVFEKRYTTATDEGLKITLVDLPMGNYVLKIIANKKQLIKKIIKK